MPTRALPARAMRGPCAGGLGRRLPTLAHPPPAPRKTSSLAAAAQTAGGCPPSPAAVARAGAGGNGQGGQASKWARWDGRGRGAPAGAMMLRAAPPTRSHTHLQLVLCVPQRVPHAPQALVVGLYSQAQRLHLCSPPPLQGPRRRARRRRRRRGKLALHKRLRVGLWGGRQRSEGHTGRAQGDKPPLPPTPPVPHPHTVSSNPSPPPSPSARPP